MGWALAIPMGPCTGYTPAPTLPLPIPRVHPCCHTGHSGERLNGPAQRYYLSVKTAFSGSPIYRQHEKRVSECVGERVQGPMTCQNVPSFLIDP